MSAPSKILVFPAGMPRALSYLQRALEEGQDVIGASSIGHDPARARYPAWVHLPYVNAPDFADVLRSAIAEFGIGGVFTPNPVVWDYLHNNLDQFPGIRLVNASPIDSEMSPYQQALTFGRSVTERPLPLLTSDQPKAQAAMLEFAALFRHAETIPGMCDHEKIRALCEIFRSSPPGDIVEIGSWWGKSAFVLMRLAQIYGVGKLLCVDPWSNEHLLQKDDKGMLDHIAVDTNEALTVFQLNLLPYAKGDINFIRLPSVDGAEAYRRTNTVTSVFGETVYDGKISVLHIDGNHTYENVEADIGAWGDLVQPGGWIIFDDYVWPYGDGPQRIGDEFLATNHDRIELSFVIGSALFVRLNP